MEKHFQLRTQLVTLQWVYLCEYSYLINFLIKDITKILHFRLLNQIEKKLFVKQNSQIDASHITNKTIEIIGDELYN